MKPERICGSTRLIVTVNAALGFGITYLIRVQLSVSLLCMVRDPGPLDLNATDVLDSLAAANLTWYENKSEAAYGIDSGEYRVAEQHEDCQSEPVAGATHKAQGDFEWDKRLQGLVLSAFFWGYVVTQIPCGWLASRFGPKHVITVGMFTATLAHILTPFAATVHPYLIILLRVVVGLGFGVIAPSIHALFGNWAPPLERSILMTPTYSGGTFACCLALALSGILCDLIGWQSIFYIYGAISCIWLLMWCYNVYNSPAHHPRISYEEKTYIQTSIGPSAYVKRLATPWGAILRSGPMWAIIVAHFCDNWGQYSIMTIAPLYMRDVLHFNIQANAVLMALPYLVMTGTAVVSSQAAGWLTRSHILTITHVRKLFQTIGFLLPAVFMVLLGFVHCSQRALAVTLLTLSVGFQACGEVAYLINHVDIAPRWSGLLCGISNTIATVPGMVAPFFAAAITPNGTQEEWRSVFMMCGAMYMFGLVVYLLLGSGEEQSWARTPSITSAHLDIDPTQLLKDIDTKLCEDSINKVPLIPETK